MPNTLAHMGVQALVTRGLIRNADLGWVWAGVLVPDLPWIAQRAVRAMPLSVDAIDLRLYVAIQSSLLFCLIAAACLASLTRQPARVFAIVALGAVLHLLLDATQTKWGNGVLLLAPLSWDYVHLDLYWPEGWPSHMLTGLGAAYVIWACIRIGPGPIHLPVLPVWRRVISVLLLAAYLLAPLPLMAPAEAEDLHFSQTYRDMAARPGKPIAIDRATLGPDDRRLHVWTGDRLDLRGLAIPPDLTKISVKGYFTAPGQIHVTAVHPHHPARRDVFTMVGLAMIALWWGWSLTVRRKKTRSVSQ
ncbi:MAG: hypothetical protein OIF47_15805 [Marinibacterium sp.]|nr:hypothetical protein [Marinibacterium sp.]